MGTETFAGLRDNRSVTLLPCERYAWVTRERGNVASRRKCNATPSFSAHISGCVFVVNTLINCCENVANFVFTSTR